MDDHITNTLWITCENNVKMFKLRLKQVNLTNPKPLSDGL